MLANQVFACHLFPVFLAASQSWNPLRATLIGVMALLWLICFASLFARDKRRSDLRHLEKKKKGVEFNEKRSHPRVSYPMFVLFRVLSEKSGTASMMASNARNLSGNGILLEVKQDLPIGTRLELKLTLSGKSSSLFLQGVVIRKECCKPAGLFAVGLALDVPQEEDRQKLADFIEQEHFREGIA